MERVPTVSGTANLLDILDRVLDKGLVIAGDVRISLANVELLTIRIRLLVCSVDKAEEIGLNWWKFDPESHASGHVAGGDTGAVAAGRPGSGAAGLHGAGQNCGETGSEKEQEDLGAVSKLLGIVSQVGWLVHAEPG